MIEIQYLQFFLNALNDLNNLIQNLLIFELNYLLMNKHIILTLIFVFICTGYSRLIAHQKLDQHDQHEQIVNAKYLSNITNLQANNWILGKDTLEQYYAKRLEITKKYNTTLCPVDKPFVLLGTTACDQCSGNTPIFDLTEEKCKSCASGEKYNANLSICEGINRTSVATTSPKNSSPVSGSLASSTKVTNISNLDANNWVMGNLSLNQYYQKRFLITKTQNISLCPKDKPFVFKGAKDCKQCPVQTPVFSLQTESCIGCASDEKYNNQTNKCQNKNQTKVTSPQSASNPVDSLLADAKDYAYVSNLDADNWVMGAMTQEQYNIKRFQVSKGHNTTLCPISTPYVLKGKTVCQQCPTKTPIFVLQSETCVGCESGQYYNITTNRCENKDAKNITAPQTPLLPSIEPLVIVKNLKNVSNLDANNWILGKLTQEEYFAKRFNTTKYYNTSLCPIKTPYVLSGKTACEQCPPETPIFALENDTCIRCIKGQQFNKTTGQCQKDGEVKATPPPNTYNCTGPDCILEPSKHINITNLDGGNWILGNMTIEKYYNDRFKITSTQNTSQCDIKTPYVISGHGGICEQCPEDRPIFVLENTTCLACPQGERWNATSRKCVKKEFPDIDTCSSYQLCPNGGFFDYQTNSCGSCEFGQYFDEEYQACLYCPDAKPLLDSSFNCVKCPAGKSIDRKTNRCV